MNGRRRTVIEIINPGCNDICGGNYHLGWIAGWGKNIGPHLPLFRIVRHPSLESAEYSSSDAAEPGQKSEEGSGIFKPVFIILLGLALFTFGFWRCLFSAQRGGLYIGRCRP